MSKICIGKTWAIVVGTMLFTGLPAYAAKPSAEKQPAKVEVVGVIQTSEAADDSFSWPIPCDPPATQKQADYCLSEKNGQQALFGNRILTITLIVTALATGASALGSFAQIRANYLTDREFKFNTRPGMQYSVSASFENWRVSHPIKVVASITNAGGVPLNGVTFAAFSVDPVTHEEFLDKKAGELLSSLKAKGAFDEMMEVGRVEKWQVETEQPDFGHGPSPNWMTCVFVGYKTTLSDTVHLSARAYYTSRLVTDEIAMRRFGASKIYTS